MASTYTDLGIEKMATGENAGTWGTKTNTNLDIIEKSIAGYVEQAVTSGGTTALSITDGDATESTSVARHAVIKLTGTITGNSIVTVPDSVEKVYIVTNGTSGAYTVQFKTASGTGITFGVSEKTTRLVYSDGTNLVDAGFGGSLDIEGRELVLDADGDTTITADTDDQIDIKIAGADDFQFTANTFTAQAGSTIAAQALTATTITASGILKTDDTTEATSTTDGSLQTDGGLSVAKDAVFGDDVKLLSDSAVLSFGADSDTTLTHTDGTGLTLNSTNKLLFGDTGTYIHQSADGVLDLVSDTEIEINATTIDINGAVAMDGAITGATNITLSGELDAATGDFSGDVDVDGTLEADAITINGTAIGSVYAALSGATFTGNIEIDVASGDPAIILDTQGADKYYIGVDDSDSDKFLIKTGGTVGSGNGFSVDSSGNLAGTGNLSVGNELYLASDDSLISMGANFEVAIYHDHNNGFIFRNELTTDDTPIVLTLQNKEADIAANDKIGVINFQAHAESTGTDAILVAAGIEAVSEGDFSSSSNATKLSFKTGASEAAAEKMSLSSAGVLTVSSTITANSQDVILGKFGGTNFSNSMLIGHATTGTLSTATNNIGIGVTALDALTSGDKNVAVGVSALTGCTEGLRNLAFGNESLEGVTTGDDNVGIGDSAGYYNATGDLNVAIGKSAMQGASGQNNSYNTAIGGDAFKVITTGGRNIGIGYQAGDNLTSGSGNVIIGGVDAGSATGSRQLKIAGYDGSTTTTWISGDNNGVVTLADDLVIKDGGTIGVSSDADAITIASNGAVTFSQTPVFPDGSIALADLDIDGGTDIGEAIVDADLFIVDNGAGGTNRKVAASRIVTYINNNSSAASTGKAIAMALVFG